MNDRADFDSPELNSLLPPLTFDRRSFIASMVAGGFALAAQPVMAQTIIKTDAEGLDTGVVEIPSDGFNMPAYYARPKSGDKFATVLVIQEIFGVHEHIQDLCRRLAKKGYLAVAPSLHARFGDETKISSIAEIMSNIVAKVADEQVMRDLDNTVAWAAKNKGNTDRLGVTGFCWGGRQTWLYAAHQPKLKAAVAWYGPVNTPSTPLTPKVVKDVAVDIKVPVLGLYGEADSGIKVADVEAMRTSLKAAGSKSEIVIYPGASHGFNADYRPSYNKEAAEDGWKRLLAWFAANGV
ncbi:MAG: twin-arginine translocation pathway signal [Rhodocyclales bacterium]|nr:twin-arginine translocation pathway signal [Rhodocyclales bacterium]